MNNDEIKYLINQFFDNDLDNEKEIELFCRLAENEECRNYFKKYNLLKQAVYHDIKPVPAGLEKKIFNSGAAPQNKNEVYTYNINKIYRLIPYAAAIVLLILALFYSRKSDAYENQIVNLTREVENQNNKIELLFHALPPIEVTSDYKQTNQIYYNR